MKAKRKMARANMQNAERNERPKRQNERDGWRQIGKNGRRDQHDEQLASK